MTSETRLSLIAIAGGAVLLGLWLWLSWLAIQYFAP